MDKKNLAGQTHDALHRNVQQKGWVSTVDVLIALGILTKEGHEDWRHGRVSYLEKVCKANLRQLIAIVKEIQAYAAKNGLYGSWTYYHGWKKHKGLKLRFSKSGEEAIERAYATHYVSAKRTAELKGQDAHSSNGDISKGC
jgi:hypothetical protein